MCFRYAALPGKAGTRAPAAACSAVRSRLISTRRAAHDVEFFYPHANPRDAGITQDFIRDAACQRLDQIDMAPPRMILIESIMTS